MVEMSVFFSSNKTMLKKNILPHNVPIDKTKKHNKTTLSSNKIPIEAYKAYVNVEFLGRSKRKRSEISDNSNVRLQDSPKYFRGEGLLDPEGYIDWNKISWKNLQTEPINWQHTSKKEVKDFWDSLALVEMAENNRVSKYNPVNSPGALASWHFITGPKAISKNNIHLNKLNAILNHPNCPDILKQPMINEQTGKINVPLTVFDTETTGLNFNEDVILQLGALKIDAKGDVMPESTLSQLINPGSQPINPGASQVHGIYNKDVENQPTMDKLLKPFLKDYVNKSIIVAYNAKFDIEMLNREIKRFNQKYNKHYPEKDLSLTIDPLVIMQRIHPFVGANKKLGDTYKYFTCSNMEGAHDALDDVRGTVDILRYSLKFLQKHADRPLQVQDVLRFQFGEKIDGLNFPLTNNGINESKKFEESYVQKLTPVINYPLGYEFSNDLIEQFEEELGPINTYKLKVVNSNNTYKNLQNFKKKIEEAELIAYNNKTPEDFYNLLKDNSKAYSDYRFMNLWVKNTDLNNPENDLPEYDLCKDIMLERYEEDRIIDKKVKGKDLKECIDKLKALPESMEID